MTTKPVERVIRVGNAPCSWGLLEVEGATGRRIGHGRMLDELKAADYGGTELGDWGFMPTDPATLRAALTRRALTMLGAFVPVALADPAAHEAGVEQALRTARLLLAVADASAEGHRPFVVLADANGSDPMRTRHAGRITPEQGLSDAQWRIFAGGAERIAGAVRAETGLRTVFHHHCAGWVETPDEIARLLDLTDPAVLALCFDTGHYTYGGGAAAAGLARFGDRLGYVHFKDCDPAVAARARAAGWDYIAAVRMGVFCELGRGAVDFPAVLRGLRGCGYGGWLVVEQDVLPGMGTPAESARRNRAYLEGLGL